MNVNTHMSCRSKRVRRMARPYVRAALAAIAVLSAPSMPAQAQAAAVTVCVVVPHFKDEYWLSVGYGLTEEAQRRGARLLTYEAGGYLSLDRQIALMEGCVERRADAILLGAVSADDPRLLDQIAAIAPRTPVIALVNALDSPALAGAVGVDWRDMGLAIGAALARRHQPGRRRSARRSCRGPTARAGPIWSRSASTPD